MHDGVRSCFPPPADSLPDQSLCDFGRAFLGNEEIIIDELNRVHLIAILEGKNVSDNALCVTAHPLAFINARDGTESAKERTTETRVVDRSTRTETGLVQIPLDV